jgi:hypothetical protein
LQDNLNCRRREPMRCILGEQPAQA